MTITKLPTSRTRRAATTCASTASLRAQLRRGPTPRRPCERPSRLHSSCPNGTRTTSGSSAHTERAATTNRVNRRPFESYKDRDTVLRAARKEKPPGVFVNEDLSQRVMARRRELMPRLREARQQGKFAYLSYDRLVVRDRVERT